MSILVATLMGQRSIRIVHDSFDRVPCTTMRGSQRTTHTYQSGWDRIRIGETYNGLGCLTYWQKKVANQLHDVGTSVSLNAHNVSMSYTTFLHVVHIVEHVNEVVYRQYWSRRKSWIGYTTPVRSRRPGPRFTKVVYWVHNFVTLFFTIFFSLHPIFDNYFLKLHYLKKIIFYQIK